MPKFKKMPNINGSTFYLQSAATINISAVGNITSIPVMFGYELVDQAVGFPIESNVRTAVWNKEVSVPIGRSYTIITMRDPVTFPMNDSCGTPAPEFGRMTPSACPSPPISMQVTSTNLTQGGIVQASLNLSYSMQYLSGCINFSGNTSKINITNVITRLTPWEGFVPPVDAKISAFNISNGLTGYAENIVYGDQVKCVGYDAYYNMSLMGSSSGTGYLIEFYGKNASGVAGNPGNAVNLAAFQNLTMYEASKFMNITLKPLAGAYRDDIAGATLNTTKMKIFVQNSSGAAITTSVHVEVKVKHPVFGTMHYIVEDISGGITYLPILANSTWAKVSVYPNEAPPVEKTLNMAATQNNVTVQVSEMTFKKPLANGSLQSINVSNKDIDTTTGVNMTFYRNDESTTNICQTPNPPESCVLTRMDANDFNPMVVMMAGKVNLELKMTGSGTTLYFVNFDLLAAKPPTNSIMSNNASSASANAQTWEAGSFVPRVYDYAYVVMPYSVTTSASNYINESLSSFNMSLPYLKDENWNIVFNTTNGSSLSSLPDDYTDFNTGIYAPLLRVGGTNCSTTNLTDICYMDKGNNSFALKVPHFSGVGSSITGLVPATAATTTTTTSSTTSSTTGGTVAETAVSESMTFSSVAADSENTFRVSNAEKISVNALIFTATEGLTNVKVTLTKLVSKPSDVSVEPAGGLYKYLKIDAPMLEGKLKEAKIQFEVTNKWLTDNGYAAGNVQLERFSDGKWSALITSKLREDSSKAYYEATTPGFSYFAISVKEAVPAEEAPVEEAPAEEAPVEEAPAEEAPVEPAAKKSNTWMFVLLGLVVVGVIVALVVKKKKK